MTHDDFAAPLVLSLAPVPQAARRLRVELRSWLRTLDAGEREVFDLVLASGEALANAIEHPLERRSPMIFVSAVLRGDNVVITIRDSGRWQNDRRRTHGGRGLEFMRSLMDNVDVDESRTATTVTLRGRLGSQLHPANGPGSASSEAAETRRAMPGSC